MGKAVRISNQMVGLFITLISFSPLGLQAEGIVGLRSCDRPLRTAAKIQEVKAGQLVDFVFQSGSALLYPIVSLEWRNTRGEIFRQEQKLDEIRGGQNFFTAVIPDSFQTSSVRLTINDHHCFETSLRVGSAMIAESPAPDASAWFFSVRPTVSPVSILLTSLLISLGLLAMVPQRKTYLLKRKLALPK